MKRALLAFVCFLVFCLAGCALLPLKGHERARARGEVMIIDSWPTAGSGRSPRLGESAMRGITLIVANPTERYAEVEVICRFEDEQLFGRSGTVGVPANSKRRIMVRGFSQCLPGVCDEEKVTCRLRRR